MAEDTPKIETVNFDGEAYAVEDLTSRVVDGFNTILPVSYPHLRAHETRHDLV